MTVYETDRREFCGLACVIQKRRISGVWQQRHIWFPPTTHITQPTPEEWIRAAIQRTPTPDWTVAPDPDRYGATEAREGIHA